MVVAELPTFELDRTQSLQEQIHKQFVSWISDGRLTAGARLPSTRRLGEMLGVSRNTAVAVIELLKAEGYVSSEVGRGSFIESSLPGLVKAELAEKGIEQQPLPTSGFAKTLAALETNQHQKTLPFTPGVPCLELFPQALWQRLWRHHQGRTRLMGYDAHQGHTPLREAIADYLRVSRGVRCRADQVLITSGAQQALSLCALMLLDDGDKVLHENPGYRGAQSAFSIRQVKQVPVPLKQQAINVDWLLSNPSKTVGAKLLYTTPTHQYPMGGLLNASDRIRLLQWAQENRLWIIEDDYDSEFHFAHAPVAAMQGMSRQDNVIYMGSFSKVLYPSLRLGYLVLPEALTGVFTKAKSAVTGESSMIEQAVIADFIAEGHFARHLRRMRQIYSKRWQELDEKIRASLGGRVEVIADSAGMHITLSIDACDDKSLARELNQLGLGGSPLSSYYLDSPERTGLVLGFANADAEQQTALIRKLVELL